jgi:membrane-associated protease RseP (regulator of RpoE activity)
MKPTLFTATLLSFALMCPFAGLAQQDDTAAKQKELDAARADLQRAAKRVADLSRQSGALPAAIHIDRVATSKPRLGVLLAGDDEAGVRITGVTPDSGAAKAGLKPGDRVLKIAGKPVTGKDAEERLAHARLALADLAPDTPVTLDYQRDGRTQSVQVTPTRVSPRIAFATRAAGAPFATADGVGMPWLEGVPLPLDELRMGIAPEVQRELRRLGKLEDCKGDDCQLPLLAEAFRWSSLNLAAVDASLGRYFGTDAGVLVLSRGDELAELQAGDVIRKVEGKAVASPRDVMDALRGKPEDARVAIEYLRDRQPRTATITVPKSMPLRLPMAPRIALHQHPLPHGAALPQVIGKRRMVIVDQDGNVKTFEDSDTPPSAPAAVPL